MTLAPVGKRMLAGLIDAFGLMVLSALAFLLPLRLFGVVLPMWGVLAVMLGWSVVPLAFLQQTVGLRVMGLELARTDGHPVDLANVLFRELAGRGLFPAAYLLTLVFGLLAQALGVMAFVVPTGLGLVIAVVCLGLFVGAMVGALVGLGRPDGRGLADLMTNSFVVVAPARLPPDDAEEREEKARARRATVGRIVAFDVLLLVGVVAAPWLLTQRKLGESRAEKTERLRREGLQQKFSASPADEALAGELVSALQRAGLADDAKAVVEKHRKAVEAREQNRERVLREQLDKTPGDERTAGLLIELLDDQGRLDDAIAVYRQWLGPAPRPSRRAGFGHWLGVRGRQPDAITELTRALDEDPLVPMGHTMLGIVLERADRLEEARTQLFYALALDPSDEDAQDAWARVAEAIGPLAKAQEAELKKTVARWTADAGR
jgi:tetratricopeptide (TPR) repeat protein